MQDLTHTPLDTMGMFRFNCRGIQHITKHIFRLASPGITTSKCIHHTKTVYF